MKGIFWFLKRPRLYRDLGGTLRNFAMKRFVSADAKEEIDRWCEQRAVSRSEAMIKLFGKEALEPLSERFKDIFEKAEDIARRCPVRMGQAGNLELLYETAEHLQAERVIETGVAYGWSSLAILLSLKNRGDSQLISTDMPYIDRASIGHVGCVVPEELRGQWRIIHYPDRLALPEALGELPILDMCHYDSDKSVKGRRWAYSLLWAALREGGIFISDDVSDNGAFRDFCIGIGEEPMIVRDSGSEAGKYAGILVKQSHS